MTRWKRNLYTLWITQILSLSGFGFGFPFMPFYIQELGVTNPDEVKLWAGILASVSGITFALISPVWGMLADRFGRKIMIMRATLAGSVVMAAISFAPNVYVVLVIRILQGFFTGTVTAAATLVAVGTPNEKLSFSLGLMASAAYIGNTIGPFIGGYAAELVGYRYSFIIGGAVILLSFLLVLLLVKEEKPLPHEKDRIHTPLSFAELKKLFSLVIVLNLGIIFLVRFTNELSKPFIAVFVEELLGTKEGASVVTGNLQGIQGILTFAASLVVGVLGARVPRGPFTSILLLGAAACCFAIFFAPSLVLYCILFPLSAFFITGTSPLTQTAISLSIPPKRRGMLFGIQTSVSSAAWAIAPLLGSAVTVGRPVTSIYFVSGLTLVCAVFMMLAVMLAIRKRPVIEIV